MADRLGPYTLEKRIGAGGMADVFLARGPMGVCVVKRPHPQLCANPEFVRMFLDEASLLAQLHHPGIAQIFDLGHVGGVYYLAMEYVPGFDLMTISLEHERHGELIAPELCARIVADASAALHYAHEARGKNGQPLHIVHRDVSPHNILVSTRGVVKVIDFGVARAATATHRTQAGFVKGKYPYMAPEQITGQEIDCRVDVYALGLVLYELLTNVRAIAGNTEVEQIDNARASRIRPIEQIRPNTPVPIQQILGGCLHPSPNGRYPTAKHLQEDLEKYLTLVRQPVGQEDLLRLFRVVAAEVSHVDFAVDDPSRPTEQEQLAVADTLPPDHEDVGFAPTAPSMPKPAAAFVPEERTAPASPRLEPEKATPADPSQVGPAVPHAIAVAPTRMLPPSGVHPAGSKPGSGPLPALIAVTLLLAVIVGGVAWWRSSHLEPLQSAQDAGAPLAVTPPALDASAPVVEVPALDAGVAEATAPDAGEADTVPDEPVRVAVLSVDAPPQSLVIVNGKTWGRVPMELELLAGDYTVTVRDEASGFTQTRRFTFAPGDKRRWVAMPPKAGKGTLEINAPPFAAMIVDGKKVTKVPVATMTLELSAGAHRVELVLEDPSLPAPRKKKRTVTVKANETARLDVNMMVDD